MEHLFTSESIISFLVLVILEVVLGIDNVIFVSIIINRLPKKNEKAARRAWIIAGIIIRSILLLGLSWLLSQRGKALFNIGSKGFDIASLVMLVGGLFLIYKSVKEIHEKLEGEENVPEKKSGANTGFARAIGEIILVDMVFSFDSMITAVGIAKHVEVMIVAVCIAMFIMFMFSHRIASFIHKHPTLKMLALSFLVLVGVVLIIEGWDSERAHDMHLKNYVYFAMVFSFAVELLNMRMLKKSKKPPVELHEPDPDKIESAE